MEERTKLQKILLLILTVMILLFGVLNIVSVFQKGVVFQESLLNVTENGDTTVYSGTTHHLPTEVTVTRKSDTLTEVTFVMGTLIHDVCTVERGLPPFTNEHDGEVTDTFRIEKNGNFLFDGGRLGDMEMGWYQRDGQWAPPIRFSVHVGGSYWENNDIAAEDILYFAEGPELVRRGSTGLYLLMVLLTVLLMVDVAFPLALFRLEHACDVRDPQPSDFFLTVQQVGWVLYPVLLLIGYIMALRSLP